MNAAKLFCTGLRAQPVSYVCATKLRNGREMEALRGSGRKIQDAELTTGVNAARFSHIAGLKEPELDKQEEVAGSLLPAESGTERSSDRGLSWPAKRSLGAAFCKAQ